jgi:hypothetical protein
MNPFGFWSPSPAFAAHKLALVVGFALWVIGIFAGQFWIVAVGGLALIVAGVAAIVGGRSVITSVTVGGGGWSWSQREISEMSPARRTLHAIVTGTVLILLGVAALGMLALSVRNDWLRKRHEALDKERGASTWRPELARAFAGVGRYGWYDALAIGGGRICYSAAGVGIVEARVGCTSAREVVSLGNSIVRRLQLSGEQLLWAADSGVGVIQMSSTHLTELGSWQVEHAPRALAGTSRWFAWDEGSAVVVRELDGAQARRQFEVDLPPQGRVVLAALGERLAVGPAKGCSLLAIELGTGRHECVLSGARRPRAADVADDRVALALEDGELLVVGDKGSTRWARVSSPLAISLVGSVLFVVTSDGVYRVRAPGAAVEPLFAHTLRECEAAGAFGELLAWQFGSDVRVIRRDAAPLEPFERP